MQAGALLRPGDGYMYRMSRFISNGSPGPAAVLCQGIQTSMTVTGGQDGHSSGTSVLMGCVFLFQEVTPRMWQSLGRDNRGTFHKVKNGW